MSESVTLNWNPCHNIPQTFWRIKSVCPVWISPSEHLQVHPGKYSGSMNNYPIQVNKQVNNQQRYDQKIKIPSTML